ARHRWRSGKANSSCRFYTKQRRRRESTMRMGGLTMIASERITVPVDGAAHRSARTAANVGYVCTGLAAIFLAFDSVLKVLRLGPAVEGTIALGYPLDSVHWIGVIEFVCLVLYLVPRTSGLGGLLLQGYRGGAFATTCAS